jgi:hypothetical protein
LFFVTTPSPLLSSTPLVPCPFSFSRTMDYSAQATPRKRSAEHFDVATPTTARKRKAG